MTARAKPKTAPRGETRRRRTAEEAQREILDAAQRRLRVGGPDAIRLQDIAGDLGISHPAILHHFGSREGLIGALDGRVILALTAEVSRLLERGVDDAEHLTVDLIERVATTMEDEGLAQLIAWWAMRNPEPEGTIPVPELIDDVAERIRTRVTELGGAPVPSLEEMRFSVRLAVVGLFGDAILGDNLSAARSEDRDAERHRFRQWLAELLDTQLASREPEPRD